MNLSIETLAKGKKELEELREIRATSLARVVTSIRQVSHTLHVFSHIICPLHYLKLKYDNISTLVIFPAFIYFIMKSYSGYFISLG